MIKHAGFWRQDVFFNDLIPCMGAPVLYVQRLRQTICHRWQATSHALSLTADKAALSCILRQNRPPPNGRKSRGHSRSIIDDPGLLATGTEYEEKGDKMTVVENAKIA